MTIFVENRMYSSTQNPEREQKAAAPFEHWLCKREDRCSRQQSKPLGVPMDEGIYHISAAQLLPHPLLVKWVTTVPVKHDKKNKMGLQVVEQRNSTPASFPTACFNLKNLQLSGTPSRTVTHYLHWAGMSTWSSLPRPAACYGCCLEKICTFTDIK